MTNSLKTYIANSGYKLHYIASKLGITYVALHNKLENKTEFTVTEMRALKSILNITDDDFIAIFSVNDK